VVSEEEKKIILLSNSKLMYFEIDWNVWAYRTTI
jgi:hypothetical protein